MQHYPQASLSHPGIRATLIVAVALAVWVALVRLPFAGDIGDDEVFFAMVAQRWLADLPPYVDSFDVKPPGIFAIFAFAQALFGTSMATVKGLEALCVAATSYGIYLIGAWHLSRRVGWFAALCYPVYTLTLAGVNEPSELIKSPFETFAVLAVLEAIRGSFGLLRFRPVMIAGLLLGIAVTIKQTAAFPALVVMLALLWRGHAAWLRTGLAFGLALTAAPAAFALLYAASGHLPEFLADVVYCALGRLHGDAMSYVIGLHNFFPTMRPIVVLLIPAVLFVTRWRGLHGRQMRDGAGLVLIWLIGEAAGIVATRSLYEYYFTALLPPLTLVAAIAIYHLVGRRHPPPLPMTLAALAVTLAWPILIDRGSIAPGLDTEAAAGAARQLAASGVAPDGRILVLDRDILVYLYADRQPASRYIGTQHMLCSFSTPDADPLAVTLAARPSAVVLARLDQMCLRDDRKAELMAALAANYCHAGRAAGPSDAFDIFIARDGAAARCDEH